MNTVVINIKVDPKVKKQAQEVAESLGFSLSAVINSYLKQLIRDRSINVSDERLELTNWAKKELKKSEKEIEQGEYVSFPITDDALEFVDTMINDDKKNKKN